MIRSKAALISKKSITLFGRKYSIRSFLQNALILNSILVLLGNNIGNFIAYIYHLVFGRILGPSMYGDLAAFVSVITLAGTAFSFFNLVIVRYSAMYSKHENVIFFKWIRRLSIIVGIVVGVVLVLSSGVISDFTHINSQTALIVGPVVALSIITMAHKSFLQGLVRFKQVVISNNLELLLRLFISLLFVYMGLQVFGVALGYLVASLLGFTLLTYYLRDIRSLKTVKKFTHSHKVYKYAIPVFLSSLATNSFFTTDVILAKHYLDPFQAGLYAALSNFGKILFFATTPIALVMFPLVAKKYKEGGNYRLLLYASIGMSLCVVTVVLLIYYFFPELMINLLFGSEYLAGSMYLFGFGVFMSIFVVAVLIINFFLSIDKSKIVLVSLFASIVQIVGIMRFHNDIFQIIKVSIVASSVLLTGSIIYLIIDLRNEKTK
ncbi:oligosaccharide flippase family protein [Patescibacteria group bacterium]